MTIEESKEHIVKLLTVTFAGNDTERNIITEGCRQIYQLGMVQGINQALEKLREGVGTG